jgi:arylsulfatase A-like enzyme
MDECIGRLLEALKDTGQSERTLVVFLSDNGPSSPEVKSKSEEQLATEPDWRKRNVAGLRGHKALVWENGCRVPLLVSWPGKIAPGERRQLSGVEDILPTLLDLSHVNPHAVPHLPFSGVTLRPSLGDPSAQSAHPDLLRMAISGPGAPRNHNSEAPQRRFEDHHLTLRGVRFKFHSLPGNKTALYDMEADPGETTDVQSRYPELCARMAKECRQRWDAVIHSGRAFAQPALEAETK